MLIFFIDVDNTLISDGKFPPENRDAIKAARKAGHLVIINTGRGRAYLPWHILEGIEYDGIIAGLGSYVEFQGKPLYCHPMTTENCLDIYDVYAKNGKWSKFEGVSRAFMQNVPDGMSPMLETRQQLEEICVNEPILKFTGALLSDNESALLSKSLRILSYGHYSEGTVIGESKGKGIKTILKHIGASPDICVAIGDSKNDLEMFEICKNSAAMGNAEDCIKKMCTYEACDAADGGVAYAIRHFIKTP